MSYIGSTPTTQSFIAGTDYFNGNGSTVNFTLSRSVNSVNDIEVIVNNVEQIPSGYSVSGTTLTFSAAPSAGTSNVYVRYLSTTNLSLAIPAGTSATFNTVTVADGSAATPSITNDGDTNTGIFFPAADRIGFAEGGVQVGEFDASSNFLFNSGYGSVAVAYGCRAWVNFNGAGALTGTYSQSGTAITVTVTSHGLSQGQSIYITFQTGAASAEAFTVTSVTSANIFVVTSATSQTTSGNCTLATIIRASGNVSSITDNGTGDYTVNFTTAMPDANYTLVATIKPTAAASSTNGKVVNIRYDTNLATSSCRLWCNSTGGAEDMDVVAVAVFR